MIDWEDEYKNLLDGFEKVESGLIPLKKHIRGIAEYFQSKGYEEVANWFWMSSSINSVEFDGIRYDSAFMMCRPAYEYEVEKQNLHSKLMTELTKFLYVYSGFEALLNTLNLPKCPNSVGKINAAKFFIKQNYTTTFSPLVCYNNTLSQLRNLIKASEMSEFEKYFSLDDCTDVNGVGLKVVYKLRNKLAHGDFAFPEPGDWTFKLPVEPEITYLSTRVILFCVQMLMLSNYKNNFEVLQLYESEVIPFTEDDDDENEWMINESDFLSGFHILPKNPIKNQLSLMF